MLRTKHLVLQWNWFDIVCVISTDAVIVQTSNLNSGAIPLAKMHGCRDVILLKFRSKYTQSYYHHHLCSYYHRSSCHSSQGCIHQGIQCHRSIDIHHLPQFHRNVPICRCWEHSIGYQPDRKMHPEQAPCKSLWSGRRKKFISSENLAAAKGTLKNHAVS